MESRAAVFTSQPQAVEVYERGWWLPASMLGWRHDSDGVCAAWVRVELAGVVEDAWVELTRLRLPQPAAGHLTLSRAPRTASRTAPDAGGSPGPAGTQQLPLVRDGGAPPEGRGVHPSGGRRRAPETGELAVVPRAPLPAVPVQAGPVAGRHRAPVEQGRHRAADAGVPTAVQEGAPSLPATGSPGGGASIAGIDPWSAPPVRSELPPAGPVVRGQSAPECAPERLTRPLRLDEGVGSLRRSRRDSLGV